MKGVRVTDGSGSELVVSMSLGCAAQITLPGSACSTLLLAPASQTNYPTDHPLPVESFLGGDGTARKLSRNKRQHWVGHEVQDPHLGFTELTVQKGTLHRKP